MSDKYERIAKTIRQIAAVKTVVPLDDDPSVVMWTADSIYEYWYLCDRRDSKRPQRFYNDPCNWILWNDNDDVRCRISASTFEEVIIGAIVKGWLPAQFDPTAS